MPNPNFRNAFVVALFALVATGLVGCHLYLGEGENCDEWGCADESINAGGDGWSCASNYDCAAGCYCSNVGYCEEYGFCDSSNDCPTGSTCDDRNSCVPNGGGPPPPDAGVPPIERCTATSDCSGDLVCDTRGLCIPPWVTPPGPSCQGSTNCSTAAPICPAGSTPEINFACYTGACMLNSDCPDGAPPQCSDLAESECASDLECGSVYRGVNCTSDIGDECTSGSVNCTCESFQFDYCEDVE